MDDVLQNLWTSFEMDWTAWGSLPGDFNNALCRYLLSTSTWTWTQTRAVWNTGLIKVHRYFEYICNWWRADFVCKSSQWLWMTMDTYLQRAILWGFLGDSWMHGNRSKRGYGSIHSWCLRGCATFLHVTGVADPTWCYWRFLCAGLWKWCRMMY